MNMDLVTLYKENFTIFIGIFVTLAIMGTTTLYDKYKSKGGASFNLNEHKLYSDVISKISTAGSIGLKQFFKFSKKLISLLQSKAGSRQKKPDPTRRKSASSQNNSGKNFPGQLETILLKATDTCQKYFAGFRNKISSLSSALPGRDTNAKEKFVPLSDGMNAALKFDETGKDNNLEKAVESKKEELDLEDDLLTKTSTSGALSAISPELKPEESSPAETSGLDTASDNNFKADESVSEIKVDGLNNQPVGNGLTFNENAAEVKFGGEKDNFLDSLKKDIIIQNEKKINFMDNMQGENLDLKLIKSDLEGALEQLNKYKQFTNRG